jgi:hypothetical protein
VREAFWAAMRSGASATEAAVIAGVSEMSALIWVKQAGYVPRTSAPADLTEFDCPPARVRAALTFTERCRLEELLERAYPPSEAAALLGRHRDTINREIDRGQTNSGYRARWSAPACPESSSFGKDGARGTEIVEAVSGGVEAAGCADGGGSAW